MAIKYLKIETEDFNLPGYFLWEISILKDLDSEYVTKLLRYHIEHNKIYLVFELLETDLQRYMDENILKEEDIRDIIH